MKHELTANINHYTWLDEHLPTFLATIGFSFDACPGIVSAHGDKCYGYRRQWEEAGIPFHYGVAIFLLSYLYPFSEQVCETKNGWVPVETWVIDNYPLFAPILKELENK